MATTAVARREHTKISRPLKVLVPLIQSDLERGDRAGMQYYADAGDKLLEARGQVASSSWGAWVSKHFQIADRTASRYMRLASLREEQAQSRGPAELPSSLSQMDGDTERRQERVASDRAFQSVLREVEPDLYKHEKQTRADEVQLHRDIALDLIDIGFKALATRLHPDRGGSKEAMARLNRVRQELKGVAETRRFV